jgi:hypothetical protein
MSLSLLICMRMTSFSFHHDKKRPNDHHVGISPPIHWFQCWKHRLPSTLLSAYCPLQPYHLSIAIKLRPSPVAFEPSRVRIHKVRKMARCCCQPDSSSSHPHLRCYREHRHNGELYQITHCLWCLMSTLLVLLSEALVLDALHFVWSPRTMLIELWAISSGVSFDCLEIAGNAVGETRWCVDLTWCACFLMSMLYLTLFTWQQMLLSTQQQLIHLWASSAHFDRLEIAGNGQRREKG